MIDFDCVKCGNHNYLCDCEFNEEMFEMLMESCGWDFTLKLGKKIVDKYYPESIFTGESGDAGPEYIVALRKAIKRIEKEEGK